MKARLVFALHFHQPVGNFDSVFEEAVRNCYGPILDHFERHPGVHAAVHFSGCLLEWLEKKNRKVLDQLVRLVGSRQLEPMGGGFYEPILTVIPREDALDQIGRLTHYWREKTGIEPTGLWLTERVWEPSLAELLFDADMQYTILDDQHLRFSGLLDKHFQGLYVTERAGRPIAFFPSDFTLRYLIPFRPVDTVRDHFARALEERHDIVLTYGDDAEKFGMWPGTHGWVFGEHWLEKFFTMLEDPGSPVRTITPGSYVAEFPPVKKVYVPNASYAEMLEWALPPDSLSAYSKIKANGARDSNEQAAKAFVRGSLWDMFFARYPESDHMHKRVLRTSRLARSVFRGTRGRDEAVTDSLRAQCNCAYWHGLFGGLYLPHLRHGVYQSVLAADAYLAQDHKGNVELTVEDFDGDLEEELVLQSENTQAFFRPSDAGTMPELDYLPSRFNFTNVVSRWRESYHLAADITHTAEAKSAVASPHEVSVGISPTQLKDYHFDNLPLRSLREFWAHEPFTPEDLSRFEGIAFAQGRLRHWQAFSTGWKGQHEVHHIPYEKQVEMEPDGTLRIHWKVESQLKEGWFGTMLCPSLLTPLPEDRSAVYHLSSGQSERMPPGAKAEFQNAFGVTYEDRVFGFTAQIQTARAASIVSTPILTLQRSEKGYEPMYQGSMLTFAWPVTSAHSYFDLTISFRKVSE